MFNIKKIYLIKKSHKLIKSIYIVIYRIIN